MLGDTFNALFTTVGLNVGRQASLIGLTVTVLLPLCLLKNLSSLAPFSLAGIAGMLYTAVAMAIRFFDGSYSNPESGFPLDVAKSLRPMIGDKGASAVFSSNAFILICMLSTAYMARELTAALLYHYYFCFTDSQPSYIVPKPQISTHQSFTWNLKITPSNDGILL